MDVRVGNETHTGPSTRQRNDPGPVAAAHCSVHSRRLSRTSHLLQWVHPAGTRRRLHRAGLGGQVRIGV